MNKGSSTAQQAKKGGSKIFKSKFESLKGFALLPWSRFQIRLCLHLLAPSELSPLALFTGYHEVTTTEDIGGWLRRIPFVPMAAARCSHQEKGAACASFYCGRHHLLVEAASEHGSCMVGRKRVVAILPRGDNVAVLRRITSCQQLSPHGHFVQLEAGIVP
jgi:hypothetical protein